MFRNQYDTEVNTWSPQGRLHQVEYAMEAVKQGSTCVGLRSDKHAVLVALNRSPAELSSTYRKVHEIDRHLGIAVAGLVADGRILSRFMRNETINHKFVFESPMPVGRLVRQVADKHQECTMRSWTRPYGAGLLVAGYDSKGPHIFQTQPDANFFEWHAIAIGARSQAAKTYLEKNFESFAGLSLDDLIVHGLKAIQGSVADGELTAGSCTVAWVGEGQDFTIAEGPKLEPFIARVRQGEREGAAAGEGQAEGGAAGQGPAAAEGGADEGQRMDTD